MPSFLSSLFPQRASLYLFLSCFGFACTFLSLAIHVPAAHAAGQSKANIRIVPLECIIEEINSGIAETYYLSPEECENKLHPPVDPPIVVPGGDLSLPPIASEDPSVVSLKTTSDSQRDNPPISIKGDPAAKQPGTSYAFNGLFKTVGLLTLSFLTLFMVGIYSFVMPTRGVVSKIISIILSR